MPAKEVVIEIGCLGCGQTPMQGTSRCRRCLRIWAELYCDYCGCHARDRMDAGNRCGCIACDCGMHREIQFLKIPAGSIAMSSLAW